MTKEVKDFNIDRDIAKDDKKMKNMLALGRQNRIKTAIQKYEDNRFMKIYLQEEIKTKIRIRL